MKTSKTKYKRKFLVGGDSTQQTPAKGGAMKGAANAMPYVSMFKQLGEGIDNAVAKKDEYGVRQGSDFAVGVGGFFNPRDATQSAINDIFKEKKFDADTALNLAAPFLGIVKANKEKRAERDAMLAEQSFNQQTQEAQIRENARNNQAMLDQSVANNTLSTPTFATSPKTLTARTGGNLNPSIYRTGGTKGRYDLIDFKGPLHEEGGIKIMERGGIGGDTIEVEGGEKMIGNTILSNNKKVKYTKNMIDYLNNQGIKIDKSALGKTQAKYAESLDRKKLKVNDTFSKNTEQLRNQPGRGGNADLERASDILGRIFNPDAEGYDPNNEQLGQILTAKCGGKFKNGGTLTFPEGGETKKQPVTPESKKLVTEGMEKASKISRDAINIINDIDDAKEMRAPVYNRLTENIFNMGKTLPYTTDPGNINALKYSNDLLRRIEGLYKGSGDAIVKTLIDEKTSNKDKLALLKAINDKSQEGIYKSDMDSLAKYTNLDEQFNLNLAKPFLKAKGEKSITEKLSEGITNLFFEHGGKFPEGGTTSDYYHTNDKGIIDAGPYAGLSLSEATEMNKLQRADKAKAKKVAQAKYVEDYTRAGMNKAGENIYEAAKAVGSFTPLGPVIGATDAAAAIYQGDTAAGALMAGAEALPYGLKYLGKGIKILSKGLSKTNGVNEVVEKVSENIPPQQIDEYDQLRDRMYGWAKEHSKYRGVEGAEDLLKTRVDEYVDLSRKTGSKESKNLLKDLSGDDVSDMYKKDFSVLTEHHPLSVLRKQTQYPGYRDGGTRKFDLNGTTGDPNKKPITHADILASPDKYVMLKPGEVPDKSYGQIQVSDGREGYRYYEKPGDVTKPLPQNEKVARAFIQARKDKVPIGATFNYDGEDYTHTYRDDTQVGNKYAVVPTQMNTIDPLQGKARAGIVANELAPMNLNIPKDSTVQEGLNEKKSQERQPYNWLAGIAGLANTALSGIANLRDVKKRKVAAQEYRAKMEELNRVPFDIQMANLSNAAQESSQTSGNYLSNMLAGTSAIANAQSQAYQNILSRNIDRQNRASEINMDARTRADYYNVGEDARVDAIKREGLQHFMQDAAGNIGSVIKNLDAQNQEASRVATMNQMYPDHQVEYTRSRWGAPSYKLSEKNPYGDSKVSNNQTTTVSDNKPVNSTSNSTVNNVIQNTNTTQPIGNNIVNSTVQNNNSSIPFDYPDLSYNSNPDLFNRTVYNENVRPFPMEDDYGQLSDYYNAELKKRRIDREGLLKLGKEHGKTYTYDKAREQSLKDYSKLSDVKPWEGGQVWGHFPNQGFKDGINREGVYHEYGKHGTHNPGSWEFGTIPILQENINPALLLEGAKPRFKCGGKYKSMKCGGTLKSK